MLANAKIDVKRYKTLWKQDSVSKQVLDTQTSLVHQLEGTVKFDQGQIDSTKLNFLYCKIKAPVSGRVGLRLVDQGNYVQTSDTTGIVVINTINPITVVFSIPEDNVPQVMEHVIAGKTLEIKAYDRAQNKLLAVGTLLTVDNQIDPTTGTVKLKAQFKNENNLLFPNQFVNIRLLVDTLRKCDCSANCCNSTRKSGYLCLSGNAQSKVKVTPVVVGPAITDNTVIKKGYFTGQSVVVEGADKLTDGAKLKLLQQVLQLNEFKNSWCKNSMNPSRQFILRPIATSLLMVAILLLGIVAYRLLPVSSLPEVDYPTIQVATFYPGASPDVMASSVTAPLKDSLDKCLV